MLNVLNWAAALTRPLIGPVSQRMNDEARRNAGQSAWELHLLHQEKMEAGLLDQADESSPALPTPRMATQEPISAKR
jgi:hypothetical protein